MNRKRIIIVNVIIVLSVILFVILYAESERRDRLDRNIENFEGMTYAMQEITANYLKQEQEICSIWAHFIGFCDMTAGEAIDYLSQIIDDEENVQAHIIRYDDGSLEGLSSAVRSDDPGSHYVTYASFSLDLEPSANVNITRAYTNPINGIQSIAFYTPVTLSDGEGGHIGAMLLRVITESTLTAKWVYPTEDYRNAEISLIDRTGDYIVSGKSFKNRNFYEFYKSYNEVDNTTVSRLMSEMGGATGSFEMLNSRGERCLISHGVVSSEDECAIVAYIPIESLEKTDIDWILIVVVASALLALLVSDLIFMQRVNHVLEVAAEDAERASVAKSDFLSNMSHEIRTPITGILGMNEMIRRESSDELVLKYSANIEKAGVSLLGIVNDILDFSKIESGKMELVESPYRTADIIADVENLISFKAEEKGLVFTKSIDPSLPSGLYGDETRIKQILTNLLSNAVKYTERGGFTLTVSKTAVNGDTVDILFSVTDTGIGIRPEDMDRMFEAFERLDNVRNRKILGTGLGLPITRNMLKMMGSELNVKSTYGKGSEFSFVLTQKVTDPAELGEHSAGLPGEDVRESRTVFTAPEARILVVDDTEMNLQVIEGLLKRTGMTVDLAGGGEECIEKFGMSDYDIVFLDYRMPVMDGIETLNKLKELYPEKTSHTPVLCLTASAVSGTKEFMINAGFTDYLSKPVVIDLMEEALKKYLPPEKVLTEEAGADEQAAPGQIIAIPGIDTGEGLAYCGGPEELIKALGIFADSAEGRAVELEQTFAAGDLEAFTLAAHSLKSTSRAVGAAEISDTARLLEQAGKEADTDTIGRILPKFLKEYRELKELLSSYFEKTRSAEEASTSGPELSDMEFSEAVGTISEFAASFDNTGILMVLDMLSGYSLKDDQLRICDELRSALNRIDWDGINDIVKKEIRE